VGIGIGGHYADKYKHESTKKALDSVIEDSSQGLEISYSSFSTEMFTLGFEIKDFTISFNQAIKDITGIVDPLLTIKDVELDGSLGSKDFSFDIEGKDIRFNDKFFPKVIRDRMNKNGFAGPFDLEYEQTTVKEGHNFELEFTSNDTTVFEVEAVANNVDSILNFGNLHTLSFTSLTLETTRTMLMGDKTYANIADSKDPLSQALNSYVMNKLSDSSKDNEISEEIRLEFKPSVTNSDFTLGEAIDAFFFKGNNKIVIVAADS